MKKDLSTSAPASDATTSSLEELRDECESSSRMIAFTMFGTSIFLILSAIIVSVIAVLLL